MPIPLVSNYLKRVYNNSNHNSDQIELFSLSLGFIPLVAAVGGKLSRVVYLAPHLGIESNFLLIPLVSNYLYMKLYHLLS